MFSALKKLARSGDERCAAPAPMSSSLQKKFSRGVHFNMKILIKGDRNVGKSCLLQRLQGGPFIEDYVPTDQIQVAPIHWTYKNTDHIVKVEVWEVVDKGRTKKKAPLGLKLENQSAPAVPPEIMDTPVLDATFLDVYKNANGVILMLDITKPWTFEYVVKELSQVPADIPVVILGNHCDMQHHRQVHSHHIDQALHEAKVSRAAPVRYAEASMRNGFGLRLLHKFLSVPFLRLQRTSLLEQLARNQRDIADVENELNEYQLSEESNYNMFVERLANKRRAGSEQTRPAGEHSPSIVLGAGKPIIPPNVNPLAASTSLNPLGIKAQYAPAQSQFVSPALLRPRQEVSMDTTPPRQQLPDSIQSTPTAGAGGGDLDEFYAGALDTSFLEDFGNINNCASNDQTYNSDSESEPTTNPMVMATQDDVEEDFENSLSLRSPAYSNKKFMSETQDSTDGVKNRLLGLKLSEDLSHSRDEGVNNRLLGMKLSDERCEASGENDAGLNFDLGNGDYSMWLADTSARRSPEGVEDPDSLTAEPKPAKAEKKHKKKKSKDKGDSVEKERKHKSKKSSKTDKTPQQQLLSPTVEPDYSFDDYDSI